jgi:hypothetical protein
MLFRSGMIIALMVDQAETFGRRSLMRTLRKTVFMVIVSLTMGLSAHADGTVPIQLSYAKINPAEVHKNLKPEDALFEKAADFELFAKAKVQQLNRNHRYSRTRMEVTKLSNGLYRGRYHEIDNSTLSVKVRRSQSSSIPYVGILSYREQVFESSASTPEELDRGSFAIVEVIPNRHIFSYQKGTWN